MRALLLHEGGRHELGEVPVPEPPPGWALVRVIASSAGLFHAQMAAGMLDTDGFPRILGHEVVGEVSSVGSAAAPPEGSLVVLDAVVGCGVCEWCIRSEESICPWMRHLGIDLDGGFADYVIVPESNMFAVPAGTPAEQAVMMGSVLPASVHAALRSGAGGGDRVIVTGVGSIGMMLCQVARAMGASAVVAADVADGHLEAAGPWIDGAVNVSGLTADEAASRLREALGSPHGADVVFEAAGQTASVDAAIRAARPGGTVLLMGICDGAAAISFDHYLGEFLRRELSLVTTFGFTRRDFMIGNALYRTGNIDLSPLLGPAIPLEEVPAALAAVAEGGTGGKRYVVDVSIG